MFLVELFVVLSMHMEKETKAIRELLRQIRSFCFRRLRDGLGLHFGVGFEFYSKSATRRQKRQTSLTRPSTVFVQSSDFYDQVLAFSGFYFGFQWNCRCLSFRWQNVFLNKLVFLLSDFSWSSKRSSLGRGTKAGNRCWKIEGSDQRFQFSQEWKVEIRSFQLTSLFCNKTGSVHRGLIESGSMHWIIKGQESFFCSFTRHRLPFSGFRKVCCLKQLLVTPRFWLPVFWELKQIPFSTAKRKHPLVSCGDFHLTVQVFRNVFPVFGKRWCGN